MKQYAQQVRSKLLTLIMTAVIGFGLATAATAAGVSAKTNVDAGAQAGGSADAPSTSGSTTATPSGRAGPARARTAPRRA